MKHTVLWLVGSPGVGKTTLVRALLGWGETPSGKPLSIGGQVLISSPKWTVTDKCIAAGWYKGDAFDGGDTVPYNGAAAALDYWQQKLLRRGAPLTILDGDRFSNATALAFFAKQVEREPGIELRCVHLQMTEEAEEARRAARGSKQNASWVKGRRTKSSNFFDGFESAKLKLFIEGLTTAEISARVQVWLAEENPLPRLKT